MVSTRSNRPRSSGRHRSATFCTTMPPDSYGSRRTRSPSITVDRCRWRCTISQVVLVDRCRPLWALRPCLTPTPHGACWVQDSGQKGKRPLSAKATVKAATVVNAAVQETAAQWALQQPAVRSTKWVDDFSRLESTTWRWWPRFVPDGTACSLGSNSLKRSAAPHS